MNKHVALVRSGLLALSGVLIGLGLLREENLMVVKKAVKICLECIGIG